MPKLADTQRANKQIGTDKPVKSSQTAAQKKKAKQRGSTAKAIKKSNVTAKLKNKQAATKKVSAKKQKTPVAVSKKKTVITPGSAEARPPLHGSTLKAV